MTTGKTKSLIDEKTITGARAALKELPAQPPESRKTARAAILSMSDLIRARIASGYTYEQISKVLSEAGVQVAAATLRAYLTQSKAAATRRQSQKTDKEQKPLKQSSTTAIQVASPSVTPVQRPAVPPRPPAFQDPDEK